MATLQRNTKRVPQYREYLSQLRLTPAALLQFEGVDTSQSCIAVPRAGLTPLQHTQQLFLPSLGDVQKIKLMDEVAAWISRNQGPKIVEAEELDKILGDNIVGDYAELRQEIIEVLRDTTSRGYIQMNVLLDVFFQKCAVNVIPTKLTALHLEAACEHLAILLSPFRGYDVRAEKT